MRSGLAHLLWRRRLPWLVGLALVAIGGGVWTYTQVRFAGTSLSSRGVDFGFVPCRDVFGCSTYLRHYGAWLGEWWTWLIATGTVRLLPLTIALGACLTGSLGVVAVYPKLRDLRIVARQLRHRAEEDPWRVRRRQPIRLPGIYGRSWAAVSQIADMFTPQQTQRSNRLFLGRYKHHLLSIYPGWGGKAELDHVLLVAPTGSGKGMLIKANLAAWCGSAVVADLKGDFHHDLGAYLKKGQRVLVFSTEGVGHRYDPFLEFDDGLGLQTAATLLIQPDQDGRNQIFGQRAALALHAGLLAARQLGRPTLPYLAEIMSCGMRHYLETLIAVGNPEVARKVHAFLSEPPNTKDWDEVQQDRFLQSCWGNFVTRVEPLCSAPILAAMSGSDFRARDLREPTTLFLHFPRETLEATLPLYQLVTEALLRGLSARDQARPEHRANPIWWVCDEAHLLKPPNLAQHLNSLRDWGVAAWIVLQSQAQLRSLYGHDDAEAIEAGCATQIYYRPADQMTPKYISERAGQMPFPQESTTQPEARPRGSTNLSLTTRPLVRPEQVMELDDAQIIVFPRGRPPVAAYRLSPAGLELGQEAFVVKRERLTPRFPTSPLPQLELASLPLQTPRVSEAKEAAGASDVPAKRAVDRIAKARAERGSR